MKEQLLKIFPFPKNDMFDDEYLKVSRIGDEALIEWGAMYTAPAFTLAMLFPLVDLLGTQNIRVDNESYGGCETCDWGSRYWHEFRINDITKNKKEFLKFCEENKGKNLYE